MSIGRLALDLVFSLLRFGSLDLLRTSTCFGHCACLLLVLGRSLASICDGERAVLDCCEVDDSSSEDLVDMDIVVSNSPGHDQPCLYFSGFRSPLPADDEYHGPELDLALFLWNRKRDGNFGDNGAFGVLGPEEAELS